MRFIKRALIRITLWLTVTAAIAYFYALQFKTGERAATTPLGHLAGRNFDRLWFAPNHDFVAIQRESGILSVWMMRTELPRFTSARPEPELSSRFVPLAQSALYSVAPDASQLVHSEGGTLILEKLFGNWPDTAQRKQMENDRVPVRMAMMESGLLGVASAGGEIDLLYVKDLKTAGSRSLPVNNPDVLDAAGPFLLVASHTSGEAWVLDSRTLPRIGLVEYLRFPSGRSVLRLTTSGRVAIGTEHGEVIAGSHLRAPGAVEFLQTFEDRDFLVAGDFKGIWRIGPNGPSREVVAAGPGLLGFAASYTSVAFATANAVEVLSLHFVPAVNPKVSDVIRVWILISLIVIAAFVIQAAILMYIAWRDRAGGGRGLYGQGSATLWGRKVRSALESCDPPHELVQALTTGKCVLWAGEELGAKSGMPGWASFVEGLLQWLEDLQFVDGKQAEELRWSCSSGKVDAAANLLQQVMENRQALLAEYVRSIYTRAAPLSVFHDLLAKATFRCVLTANLDALMEKTFASRSPRLFLPSEIVEAHSSLVKREFFVLKLRGVCEFPDSIVLTPVTAAARLKDDVQYREFRKEIFSTYAVLLVDLNLPELETWLAGLEPGAASDRKHYALAPVIGRGWEKTATRLGKKYSVRILTYSADDTRPLQAFLEKLIAAQARSAGVASA